MATIASAVNTVFTPVVGSFIVQASAGPAILERRNTATAPWCVVTRIEEDRCLVISNPVAAADYRFSAADATTPPTVQADQ